MITLPWTNLVKVKPLKNHKSKPLANKSFSDGITLIELLITSLIAGIVVIAATRIFFSQAISEKTLLGGQSSENLRSRISFLLESDVADGEAIINSSNALCPSVTGSLFSIRSPYLDLVSNTVQYACISYSQEGDDLFRTGPPILANGSLDNAQTAIKQLVAKGVKITNASISTSGTKIEMNIIIPGFLGSPTRSYPVAYGTKNFRVGT